MTFDPSILRVMAVTDGLHGTPDRLVDRVVAAVLGGATCLQVRLKGTPARMVADVTRELVRRVRVPVIVNDRFDIALAAGAAGVHLGADDISVAEVRRATPPSFIVGASVGCDAEVINAEFADYVGIGPVYGTHSKSDAGTAIGVAEFARLAALTGKPAVGIGGVTVETARAILDAGGVGIAVIGAIFASPNPGLAATELLHELSR